MPLAALVREIVVPDPTKVVVGKFVTWGFETNSVITYHRAKVTGYNVPEASTIERKVYNTTSKLSTSDVSIAHEMDPIEITLELDEPRSTEQLALLNARALYGTSVIWVADPRDALTKCTLNSNVFGTTLLNGGMTIPDDAKATLSVKLKVTNPDIVWTADTTISEPV